MLTVATFSKPEDAHLLRMRLEAGGVPAFIQDEAIVQIYWLYSDAIGGIRVQIQEEDLERAKEILQDHGIEEIRNFSPELPDNDLRNVKPDSDSPV